MNLKQALKIIISLTLVINFHPAFAQEAKLIFALDVIRHGDRTSLHDLPTQPHYWKEGNGQLTAKGMKQEYDLGVKLRKRYIDEAKLLPASYQPKTIYVRSTDLDRTLMSAQSLLMGLYPLGTGPTANDLNNMALPQAFQPIPIHTKEANDKDVLLVDTHGSQFQQAHAEHVKTHKVWLDKNNELKNNYPRWSKATGIEITDIRQLISLGNILYIYQDNQISLPATLSTEDINQIIGAGKWAFCFMFKPQEVANITGKPLLELIVTYLAQTDDTLKYVLLSGHDSSLLALLSALGVPLDQEPPPYASHVNFSLYETKNKESYVVISYNETPLTLPACGGTQCRLEQLTRLSQG